MAGQVRRRQTGWLGAVLRPALLVAGDPPPQNLGGCAALPEPPGPGPGGEGGHSLYVAFSSCSTVSAVAAPSPNASLGGLPFPSDIEQVCHSTASSLWLSWATPPSSRRCFWNLSVLRNPPPLVKNAEARAPFCRRIQQLGEGAQDFHLSQMHWVLICRSLVPGIGVLERLAQLLPCPHPPPMPPSFLNAPTPWPRVNLCFWTASSGRKKEKVTKNASAPGLCLPEYLSPLHPPVLSQHHSVPLSYCTQLPPQVPGKAKGP